ncbi:MAG: double-strand break repair protein AddB [Alphaproteobacteria bacterium]
MLNLWNIPTGMPFLQTLVEGLPRFCEDHQIGLGDVTLYLPYARAGTNFKQMLLERYQGAFLLPRIEILGEWTDDALEFPENPDAVVGLEQKTIPPLVRQALLAQLVREKQTQLARQEGMEVPPFQMTLQLVEALIAFLDQACIEEVSLENLAQLVPETFASHWQLTLDFMRIIQIYWPQLLLEKGYVEPYVQHHQWVQRKLAAWQQSPPSGWVLAAGSTGTMPATATFLKAIASLPKGGVILPGLDPHFGQQPGSENISACHPQYALQQLLKRLGRTADSVPLWPWALDLEHPLGPHIPKRQQLVRELFQASFETPSKEDSTEPPSEALSKWEGIHYLACASLHEEAETIALMLREALETPGKTIALVSADRLLLHQVFAALKRWQIVPYNSASSLFSQTDLGSLIHLALQAIVEQASPIPLLSLLKHPLCCVRDAPLHQAFCFALEQRLLRGIDPGRGFASLREGAASIEQPLRDLLEQGIERLSFFLEPLLTLQAKGEAPLPFSQWVQALGEVIHRLCPPEVQLASPKARAVLSSFLEGLQEAAIFFPEVSLEDAVEGIWLLIGKLSLPPEPPTHPRIRLLGTLEARLLQADTVILGGLNEGTWPPLPNNGPWLNRPMRDDIGMPPLERRIGLSAHDFCQTFGNPTVVLTRALRAGGTPTVPSRFLARLETLLKAEGKTWKEDTLWRRWALALDAPQTTVAIQVPAPCPPVHARPRQLSVTQIEMWRKDPYALYARHVLRLKPLDPLNASPDHALQGTLLHQVFDLFLSQGADLFAPTALEELLTLGREKLAPFFHKPAVQTFWWQRFQKMASWFLETERQRRLQQRPYKTFTEVDATVVFQSPAGPFRLKARADRVDVFEDGTVDLIDYKTGFPPAERDVVLGYAPQLPLEAGMLWKGGFRDIAVKNLQLGQLHFWHVSGRLEGGDIKTLKSPTQALAEGAWEGLQRLIEAFDEVTTPYYPQADPTQGLYYPDYMFLARFLEWNGRP